MRLYELTEEYKAGRGGKKQSGQGNKPIRVSTKAGK